MRRIRQGAQDSAECAGFGRARRVRRVPWQGSAGLGRASEGSAGLNKAEQGSHMGTQGSHMGTQGSHMGAQGSHMGTGGPIWGQGSHMGTESPYGTTRATH